VFIDLLINYFVFFFKFIIFNFQLINYLHFQLDEVTELLGKGTFGKVFKCYDRKHRDYIAMKIVRKIPRYVESAKIEGRFLNDVYMIQQRQSVDYCVKIFSQFQYHGIISFYIYTII
jgi:serine/threonine protein kinase